MEDIHRLLQLLTDRRHHRRKDIHHAWWAEPRSSKYGTNKACHASHRRSRYRSAPLSHLLLPSHAATAATHSGSPCGRLRCFADPPCPLHSGLLCDLLWSDPDKDITGWSENDRGVSFTFGPDVVSRFLQKHDMDLICRAHQVVEDGYEFFAKRQLVTLFSAPNYCGEFDNAGAMMSVDETLLCSFQVGDPRVLIAFFFFLIKKKFFFLLMNPSQILKPAEKKAKFAYNTAGGKSVTPPRSKGKKKEGRLG